MHLVPESPIFHAADMPTMLVVAIFGLLGACEGGLHRSRHVRDALTCASISISRCLALLI
jgi:hypothetical protein